MKKESNGKMLITIILLLAAAAVVGVAAALLYVKKQEAAAEKAAYDKLMAVELSNPDMPEEYRRFKSENPDVYAWLEVVGTEISWPVAQSAQDNGFYITHDALGRVSDAGAVFTENYNARTFEDPDTVLYGNSGEAESVFAALSQYEDPSYFEDHREIRVYLPDRTITYRIFATYIGDNVHLLLNRDLSDKSTFEHYIDQILGQRGMKTNVDKEQSVTAESKLLTLSTSHPSSDTARFLVQAVREDF